MPELGRFSRELRARLWKPSVDDEVRDEMAHHLDMMMQDLLAQGVAPDEARRRAEAKFGDVARLSADCRTSAIARDAGRRRSEWWSELTQDVRQAVRQLRNAPRFAFVAIFTLAVGLGAATTIFGIANAVLLRPLAYPDADRLVIAREMTPAGQPFSISEPDYLDWSARQRSFASLAIFVPTNPSLVGDGEPEQLRAAWVTHTLADVLGVAPELGRFISADQDRRGGDTRVVVISHDLWQRRYGGDPGIIGRSLDIDAVRYRVVGIMPPAFEFPDRTDAWMPLRPIPDFPRGDRRNEAVGRLRPGVSMDAAWRELRAIQRDLAVEYPASNEGWSAHVEPFKRWYIPESLESRVKVLLVTVALLLIMACTNVANLLVARSATREREMAVRATLGAGRWRMARQLLTESLVLSVLGALAGVGVAMAATPIIKSIGGDVIPRLSEMRVDWRVLLFAIPVCIGTGLAFGMAPALRLSRPTGGGGDRLHATLRSGTRVAGNRRVRHVLVVSSVALAMVLLVSAGLVATSFRHLMGVELGYSPREVMLAGVNLPNERYNSDKRAVFFEEAIRRLAAIPGVRNAAAINIAPFGGGNTAMRIIPAERLEARQDDYKVASWRVVTPDFFSAMSVRRIAGRTFTSADRPPSENVVVINEALAHTLFPGASPIGRRVTLGNKRTMTVIGVVGDTRVLQLDSLPAPAMYFNHAQFPWQTMWFTVRFSGNAASVVSAIRREIAAMDPVLPVSGVRPLADVVSDVAAEPRLTMLVFAIFATSALLLAAVGLYGVVSFGVSQRTREIGVSMALGAPVSRVMRGVLREGGVLAGIGVVIGSVAAYGVSGILRVILYETERGDPRIYVAVAALLLLVAALASAIPARRAARLDPVVALRAD